MDPTGAEDPGNQAAPVCDTEVLKPLGKKSFRPSGGNALQAAFISLVELTLLFAERELAFIQETHWMGRLLLELQGHQGP